MTGRLLAHGVVDRDELWSAWGGDPVALVALGAFAIAYANGALAARGRPALAAVVRGRAAFGAAAVIVLAITVASPLDAAASALFAAHMVQHLLLTAVAAPLLVLSAPVSTIQRGLPSAWSSNLRSGHRWFVRRTRATWPVVAALTALGTLSVWHLPALYEAALRSDLLHALEHATLLLSGVALWSAVVGSARRRQVLWSVAALALAAVHGAALGALIALSARPWYDGHAAGAASWGIDPLADQQVAGAIMWVPTAAVHLGALAVLLHRWLRDADRPATRPDRPAGAAASAAP